MIDVPELVSSANETLEWIADNDVVPSAGTAVTMIIEPAGAVIVPATQPTTRPLEKADAFAAPAEGRLSDVAIDQEKIDRLQKLWNQKVSPRDAALREAAQAQYEVITQLRREQQRLIDEADRIQRLIDDLEKKYQDMTTPRPEPVGK